MNEKELNALISLLEDPDQEVFTSVRSKLVELGIDVLPELENAWESNFDSLVQDRAEQIIHDIYFKNTVEGLNNWIKKTDKNLLEAWFIISKYQYPDLDEAYYRNKIYNLSQQINERISGLSTDLDKISAFNKVFFIENEFRGNIRNFHSADNSFINRVLDSRKGNPLSLCMLYILISQQIGLPVCGVNMPKHFILAYEEENEINGDPIKFYINPFSKGSILNRQDLEVFLKREKLKEETKYFTPCGNTAIIKRLINNLLHSFTFQAKKEKAQEMITLIRLFKSNNF
jgi:regulator of sirC expression with transglutaminase-like and TPR domain